MSYEFGMNISSQARRFSLSQHPEGDWNVIDLSTGGPAEVWAKGQYWLLWKLPEDEARSWFKILSEGHETARSQRLN